MENTEYIRTWEDSSIWKGDAILKYFIAIYKGTEM